MNMISGEQAKELENDEKKMIIMVWGSEFSKHHQHHLETCWKFRFLILDLLNQKFRVGPSNLCFIRPSR